MIENKITYLLGAGASAEILPVVNKFAAKLKAFHDWISKNYNNPDNKRFEKGYPPKSQIKTDLLNNIDWLAKEAQAHASIDTYAKKLYIQKDYEKLKKLKATLACYFLIEQAYKGYDKRYDSLIASIIELHNGKVRLPQNINILTWNYDSQFEIAFNQYCLNVFKAPSDIIQAFPIHSDFKNEFAPNIFSILHLNGIAGAHKTGTGLIGRFLDMQFNFDNNTIEHGLECYANYLYRDDLSPYFNFAWEDNEYSRLFHKQAINIAKPTEILVVIGYSFPYFNREIDRQILNAMKNLSDVYIQAPEDQHEALKDRFSTIRQSINRLIMIKDTGQFFIPDENTHGPSIAFV